MTTFYSRQRDRARPAYKKANADTFNFASQIASPIYTVIHTKRVKTDATSFESRCSRTVMFAAGGIIAALGTGFPKFKDEEVLSAVAKLRGLSDFAGLRLEPTGAILALFIYADALSDETIIGKSLLIRDEIKNFKQFGLRIAFAKGSAFADMFFVFQSSDKCLHFRHSVQERCKHVEFFAKVYALPWCIDLSAKSVWPYSGHPFIALRPLKPTQIEAGLFC